MAAVAHRSTLLRPGVGWEPLSLTADAVRHVVLDQFGLTTTELELMPGGFLNQTWRLAADHALWVVRVSRPGRTVDQVGSSLAMARVLADLHHAALAHPLAQRPATACT